MIRQAPDFKLWAIYLLWRLKSLCYYLGSSQMLAQEGSRADCKQCAINFVSRWRSKNEISRDEIFRIAILSFFRKMKWTEKTGKGYWNKLRLKWWYLYCKIAIGREHLIKINTSQTNTESFVVDYDFLTTTQSRFSIKMMRFNFRWIENESYDAQCTSSNTIA